MEGMRNKETLLRSFETDIQTGLEYLSERYFYCIMANMNFAYDLGLVEKEDIRPLFEKIYGYLNDPNLRIRFTEEGSMGAYRDYKFDKIMSVITIILAALAGGITTFAFMCI